MGNLQPPHLLLACTLTAFLTMGTDLAAHGGITPVKPPWTPITSGHPGPLSPSIPGDAGSGAQTGRPSARSKAPAATPTAAGVMTRSASRGVTGRGASSATTGPESAAGPALDGWEPWWDQNKDRFLDLRGRLLSTHSVSGSSGLLTGRGRKSHWRTSRRAGPEMVDRVIVPSLLGIIEANSDRDILDSAVLALARSAPEHRAGEVLDAIIPLLAHRELSVQSSAALSLGVLQSKEATSLLLSLAADDSTGRKSIGGGPVPRQVRAHAAFALGLVADPRSVHRLLQLITRLPDSERDVKASAVAGLGMLPTDHSQLDVVQTVLVELLGEKRLDPMVASYIPTTLAKLQLRTAIPALLRRFDDPDTDRMVRHSIVLALGRTATMKDFLAVKALVDEVTRGRDRLTRHFALMSLAQMGTTGVWSDDHAELAQLFGREVSGQGKSQEHRSWAALAAALLGRAHPQAQPMLLERLRDAYENENAPSYKGAFALALGLLRDTRSTDLIHADFRDVSDTSFRSHAATALGFLDAIGSSDELRQLCLGRATPDDLRLASATALGLLGDREAVPVLVEALRDTGSLSVRSALAKAVGLIGDRSAVEPLLAVASDTDVAPLSRAFACVAVGLLAERSSLPFNEPLKADGNYVVPVDSIQELLAIL